MFYVGIEHVKALRWAGRTAEALAQLSEIRPPAAGASGTIEEGTREATILLEHARLALSLGDRRNATKLLLAAEKANRESRIDTAANRMRGWLLFLAESENSQRSEKGLLSDEWRASRRAEDDSEPIPSSLIARVPAWRTIRGGV